MRTSHGITITCAQISTCTCLPVHSAPTSTDPDLAWTVVSAVQDLLVSYETSQPIKKQASA